MVNLLKFAFGLDPMQSAPGPIAFDASGLIAVGLPTLAAIERLDNSPAFRAVFARRKDYAAAQLDYRVEFSVDLLSWWASPDAPILWDDKGADHVELMYLPFPELIDTPSGTEAPGFFRVRVEMFE